MHRYTVEFRLSGETLHPEDITAVLGLKPTTSWHAGDIVGQRPRTAGMWGYAPGGQWRQWQSLEPAISALLDELEPLKAKIAELQNGYEAYFWCCHFNPEVAGGPRLSPALLKRLAAMEVEIYVDTHFVRDDPQDIGCTP
ncbi:MAG: DUF4279 domain-containing protein [Terriglobales bacterium]